MEPYEEPNEFAVREAGHKRGETSQSDCGAAVKQRHDFKLNKRGQVRPCSYQSKHKKMKNNIFQSHFSHTEEANSTVLWCDSYSNERKKLNERNSSEFEQVSACVNYDQESCTPSPSGLSLTAMLPEEVVLNCVKDIESEQPECQETKIDDPVVSNEELESQHDKSDFEEIPFDVQDDLSLADELIHFIKQKESFSLDELLDEVKETGNIRSFDENVEEELEDQSDSESSDSSTVSADAPIMPGHWMSLKTCVLLIWLYAIAHNLTSGQISDLLTLVNLILFDSHSVFKSLHRFKRFFDMRNSPFKKHYYYSFCFSSVDKADVICQNVTCGKELKDNNSRAYFLELPVQTQLSNLFGRKDFRKMMKYKESRIKFNPNNIEDIYDSVLYRHLSKDGGPLDPKKENNVSFTLNTDGIPIFKSSKMSIWPIYLMINEIPFRNRKCRENMLLCGLWFGTQKPLMNFFGEPLHSSLKELEKGITLKLETESILVQGFLFSVTCDIPARSLIMNMNQHNGEFCCPKCLNSGSNYRTVTGGNIRVFPFTAADINKDMKRNHQQCVEDAYQAMTTRKTVHGIKGPSFLMFCPNFDFVDNIAIDYMHLLFLGTVRLLMNMWFGISHSLEEFSLYKYVNVVDERLCNIQPSLYVSRLPRAIGETLKFWKASEFRSWFFYYSVPCVMDLLQPKYLYHYCTLLEAIFLLNKTSISEIDLEHAERLLNYFVFMTPVLYGERYMTINVHSLIHLTSTVRNIGPLWANSCFAFESANGDLLKMFHGTQYVDIQMMNAVNVYQCIPNLGLTFSDESPALPFVNKLLHKQKSVCDYNFQVLGKGHKINISKHLQVLVNDFLNKPTTSVLFFKKASIRGIHFYTQYFNKSSNRNSYSVKYVDKRGVVKYGFVCWFASSCDGLNSFACISSLEKTEVNLFSNHHRGDTPDSHFNNIMNIKLPFVHFLRDTKTYCVVPLRSILCMCICINQGDHIIFCEEPNHHEINLLILETLEPEFSQSCMQMLLKIIYFTNK